MADEILKQVQDDNSFVQDDRGGGQDDKWGRAGWVAVMTNKIHPGPPLEKEGDDAKAPNFL